MTMTYDLRRRLSRWAAVVLLTVAGVGSACARLPDLGPLPALDGATGWLNSQPLAPGALRGKVVLIDFWTYSCINCIRTLPHVRAWADKYRAQGLVVIGVHTPEFAFEQDPANVQAAVNRFQLGYPIAIDSERRVWEAFHNFAWPVFYVADGRGRIRARVAGEGSYEKVDEAIQALLAEAGRAPVQARTAPVQASGEQAAPDLAHLGSSETYVGYAQASGFVPRQGLQPERGHTYVAGRPGRNEWSLGGAWTVGAESARLDRSGGSIVYRFRARDLHLVLGTSGPPVRFRVTLDGQEPGGDHGSDTDAGGRGVVTGTRLYQLVRQSGPVTEHLFEIRFLDPGALAYAFTFG